MAYVRFSSHAEAAACVEAQAGQEEGDIVAVWSESERAGQRAGSVYGLDLHNAFAGPGGRIMNSVLATLKVKAQHLFMLSDLRPAKEADAPKPQGKQLQFAILCTERDFHDMCSGLASVLKTFHEKVTARKRAKEEPKDVKMEPAALPVITEKSSASLPPAAPVLPEDVPDVAESLLLGDPVLDRKVAEGERLVAEARQLVASGSVTEGSKKFFAGVRELVVAADQGGDRQNEPAFHALRTRVHRYLGEAELIKRRLDANNSGTSSSTPAATLAEGGNSGRSSEVGGSRSSSRHEA